ncbi:MAG: hypothetical protein H6Q68_498 [Firmicutes bacterium]|nr:hypothetical protein [Bacillota bacterium]
MAYAAVTLLNVYENSGTGATFQAFQMRVCGNPVILAICLILILSKNFKSFKIKSCFCRISFPILIASIPNRSLIVSRSYSSLRTALASSSSRQYVITSRGVYHYFCQIIFHSFFPDIAEPPMVVSFVLP